MDLSEVNDLFFAGAVLTLILLGGVAIFLIYWIETKCDPLDKIYRDDS